MMFGTILLGIHSEDSRLVYILKQNFKWKFAVVNVEIIWLKEINTKLYLEYETAR